MICESLIENPRFNPNHLNILESSLIACNRPASIVFRGYEKTNSRYKYACEEHAVKIIASLPHRSHLMCTKHAPQYIKDIVDLWRNNKPYIFIPAKGDAMQACPNCGHNISEFLAESSGIKLKIWKAKINYAAKISFPNLYPSAAAMDTEISMPLDKSQLKQLERWIMENVSA